MVSYFEFENMSHCSGDKPILFPQSAISINFGINKVLSDACLKQSNARTQIQSETYIIKKGYLFHI